MINIVKDVKEMKEPEGERKPCTILCESDTHQGTFERCRKTGDLRILLEDGFSDEATHPVNQLVTIKLEDGSNGEYHGRFDEEGNFSTTR
jgi:hypothetical protein